jgi:AraC family ethanolamine operon transcriptional activator
MVSTLLSEDFPVPGLLLDQEFHDVESLNRIFGWDLDWRQIEPGPLVFRLTAFGHTDISVMRVEFNRSFHQIGNPPNGAITLGLPDVESGILKWNGADVNPGTLINFNSGKLLDTVNQGVFGGFVISLSEAILSASFADAGLDPKLLDGINQFRFWSPSGEHEQLRRILHALKDVALSEGDDGLERWALVFNQDLPAITTSILSSVSHQPDLSAPMFQVRALERALHIISNYDEMPVSIKALSTLAGASWSTIERAFLKEFGIVPKAYMRARRLGVVQAELIKQGPGATIGEVASQCGFQHMSSFAADYRKQFGESPSETLKRLSRVDSAVIDQLKDDN